MAERLDTFSSDWAPIGDPNDVELAQYLSLEVVPMSAGYVALLIQYARGPRHAEEVKAGTSLPDRVQLVMPHTDASRIGSIISRAGDVVASSLIAKN